MVSFREGVVLSLIGKHGSGLGFGCMGITAFYGDPLPDEKAMALLKGVYDAGCRHFDTAEIYRTGDLYNEQVLGKFFKTVPRDSFTVATKYMPQAHGLKNDYDTVKAALRESLDRLGLDYVDLYYSHRITDLEGALEFGRSAKKLRDEGLVKEVGLSEIGPAWLKKVHTEACPIAAIQQEWSLVTRNLEVELIPMCKELGIAIVAYSPLSRNLLASKLEAPPADWRAKLPRYEEGNLKSNQKIIDILQGIADKYGCTLAQIALGWLFQKADQLGVTVVPIPGTTKLHRALSNIQSTQIKEIKESDMQVLENLADIVVGARGDESYIKRGFESQSNQ